MKCFLFQVFVKEIFIRKIAYFIMTFVNTTIHSKMDFLKILAPLTCIGDYYDPNFRPQN